jgi:uncharacterized protein YjeT (DUF2065 family)
MAKAVACGLTGPSGMFAVAILSKWLEDPLTHNLPVAGALVAVLAGVSEHLAGDATRHAITSLNEAPDQEVAGGRAAGSCSNSLVMAGLKGSSLLFGPVFAFGC